MATLRDLFGGLFGGNDSLKVNPTPVPANTGLNYGPSPTSGLSNVGETLKNNALPAGTYSGALPPVNGAGSVLGDSKSSTPSQTSTTSSNKDSSGGGYDKSKTAASMGISTSELTKRAKDAGFNSTEAYVNALKKEKDAQIAGINSQYDNLISQYERQLPYLAGQHESNLATLNSSITDYQAQIEKAKTEANSLFTTALNRARQGAADTVKATRNALRGLGILGSSAAGEMLTKPVREFDTTRGELNQDYSTRLADLSDQLNRETAKNVQAVKDLELQYAKVVADIMGDIRFNKQRKVEAIDAAEAALQAQLAEIEMAQQQFEQQLALNAPAQTSGWTPEIPQSEVPSTLAGMGAETPQTAQIYGQDNITPYMSLEEQKKKLSELQSSGAW